MTENQDSSAGNSATTIAPPPPPNTPVRKTGEMPKPRRRRWPFVLIGIFLLLVILVLALPSLLCTGPGVRFIEQQINSRIKGHLTIGSISLGWFSPAQIKNVTLQDSHRAIIARNLTVNTNLSLIRAISNWKHFGKVTIQIGELKLVTQANGLNIVRALASRSTAAPAGSASPARTAAPSAPTQPASSALPALNGQLDLTIDKLEWTSPSTPTVNATATSLSVAINTSGKPLAFTFSTAVAATPQPPAHIALSGKLKVFAANQILPADKITGTLQAKIQSLNLESLNPLLASMGVRLTVAGSLNGHVAVTLPAPGQGQAAAQLQFAALELGGRMLKGDSPKLGNVQIPLAAKWNAQHFNIHSAQIENNIASLTLQASGSIPAVTAILHHAPADGQTATVHLAGKADIAALAGELPHMLGVPADTHVTQGTANWSMNLTLGSKVVATATRSGPPPTLPPVAGRIMFAVNGVTWKSPLYPHARTANADGQLTINTQGQPIDTVLHLSVLHGTHAPSVVSLNGKVLVFGQQTILPLTAITGSMGLKISDFYLDYLNPILNRFHAPLQTHGVLSADLQLTAPAVGNGALTGQLAIANCGFQGSFIKQDNPELGLVRIPVNLAWQGQHIMVHQLGVLCQAVNLRVHGQASINTLQAMAANKPTWGNAHLQAQVQANLHLLGADFPKTLGLRKLHAKIDGGTVQVKAQITSQAKSAAADVQIAVSNVTGRWNDRNFSVYPLLVGFSALRVHSKWLPTLAQVQQAATATGNPAIAPLLALKVQANASVANAYVVHLAGNLQPLTNELAQFSSTQNYADSGQWTLLAHLTGVGTAQLTCRMKTEIKNASLVLMPGKPAYTDPDIRIATNVSASMADGAWQALHCTLFTLHTQFADIGPATAEIRKNARGIISIPGFDLPIERLSLTKIQAIMKTLAIQTGAYRMDGSVVNSSVIGSLSTTQVNLSALHLVLQNLALAARGKPTSGAVFKEAGLTLDTAGSLKLGGNPSVDLKPLNLVTADHLITVTCSHALRFAKAPTGLNFSCQGLTAKVNLHLLSPLLAVLQKLPPADQLNGLATLSVQASGNGPAFAVNTNAAIANYQLQAPTSKVQLAPTNIALNVVGQGNLGTHTFTCLSNCGISEQPPAGGAGNGIVINKGSTLAWAAGGTESVRGSVHYDLQRLQTLLSPWLPKGLTMQGQEVMPLAISGPWVGGTGLRQFRKLTVQNTAFAFEHISIDGIHLGPGQIAIRATQGVVHLIPSSIPANQGTIHLAGIIDLNRKHPAYVLTTPLHLVDNMQLNTALGSSVLKFLPISWGMSFKPVGGVAKISGLLNLSLKNADIPLSSQRLKQVGTLAGTVSATHVSSDSPLYSLIASLNPQHFLNMSGGQAKLSDSGIRPTNFHLKAGKVYYKDMKVVLVSMGVDFSGWVALNNTLDVDVSVTGGGLAVPLPLKITGTTAKPHLKLTGKPLKNIGKDIGNTIKNAGGLLKGFFH